MYENLPIISSSHKNIMPRIAHYDTFYLLRYVCVRYVKCLFVYKHPEKTEYVKN